MRDLSEIRDEIDGIDREIVELFEERLRLVTQVAEYKIANSRQVLDRGRELSKLTALEELAGTDFSRKSIRELFEQIMSISRKRQYQLLAAAGQTAAAEFQPVEEILRTDVRVVYQGVEGAYSQMAMEAFFGDSCDSFHVESWRDAMEAIKQGDADYAVLPIENSSAGIVSENYDLLEEYDNCIVGEQTIQISHALLGLPGTRLADLTCVYSHPQALMQCVDFLDEHRDWERISLKNTAVSAQKVLKDGKRNQAAIANPVTARLYGLEVLKEAINYSAENSTRFIIVTGRKIYRRDAGKISICFELPHESGSLYQILSHFIYNDLNMNKIESRPIKNKSFEYRFFVDFEGNLADAAVQNALKGVKEEALGLRVLGNY
ncbi:MAG: prephenate dehydratase [Lachnospiraceae bacterium]|nr:prephenate dehydratase [Lachnospiraceae bacterium]MCI9149627.1 prephenate dehydratase [Lachnospiraceae bacterium]